MNENTFGPAEKYKMLPFLTEKINLLDYNRKAYISTFIQDFNQIMNKFGGIHDRNFKNYLLDLTYTDYMVKTMKMGDKYDEKIITYLNNFIHARIKNEELIIYKVIGVIAFDRDDFMSWKKDNNIKADVTNLISKFSVGDRLYKRICSPSDLCSNRFEEVLETTRAKENEYYGEILRILPGQMS